jgi:hypothetical protein
MIQKLETAASEPHDFTTTFLAVVKMRITSLVGDASDGFDDVRSFRNKFDQSFVF